LWDKLVGFVAQDWITARLHILEQPLYASLFPVMPAVNHAGSIRVLVTQLRTSLKEV